MADTNRESDPIYVTSSDRTLFQFQVAGHDVAQEYASHLQHPDGVAEIGPKENSQNDSAESTSAIDVRPTSDQSTVVRQSNGPTWQSALVSTLASLAIVLTLLAAVRFLLPPMLESARYSWYRGQLRAQHEAAGETLKNVSLDGLSKYRQRSVNV